MTSALIDAAYDSYLPAFAELIPALLKAYDETPAADPLRAKTAQQIALLRDWDYRWSTTSVPTSLAVFWGDELGQRVGGDARRAGVSVDDYVVRQASAEQRLQALVTASEKLAADFGTWRTPWGEINRFQRLTGDIVQPFNEPDRAPGRLHPARWDHSRRSVRAHYRGTKKWYGHSGTASSRSSSSATACALAR